jgi:hypothetical protein
MRGNALRKEEMRGREGERKVIGNGQIDGLIAVETDREREGFGMQDEISQKDSQGNHNGRVGPRRKGLWPGRHCGCRLLYATPEPYSHTLTHHGMTAAAQTDSDSEPTGSALRLAMAQV